MPASPPSSKLPSSRLLHPFGSVFGLASPKEGRFVSRRVAHPHQASSLLLSSSFPALLGFVFVHILNVINERSREDGIIRHFSLTSLTGCLIPPPPPVSTQARFLEPTFKCCLARLVWSEEGLVPLTPSPHASSTSPQIQDAHPPPEGGSRERTPKCEWLFQASVAVETGCTGLGGPLYHPPATQPMGHELHPRRPRPTAAQQRTNGQVSWLRVLPSG